MKLMQEELMNQEIHLPEILTAKEISVYLKISRRRVYELFILKPEFGGIPNIAIGASKRVRKKDFIRWIQKKLNEGGGH